jgi:hypothetical protein
MTQPSSEEKDEKCRFYCPLCCLFYERTSSLVPMHSTLS